MRYLLTIIAVLTIMLTGCGKPHDGANGQNGLQGPQGASGQSIVGPAGANGKDGTNATPVTVVKLCNDTPAYPSVFVEDALCINDQLYAVYSIPGAFLTLLTPGMYTSQGIGSSCGFEVRVHCQVLR